MPFEQSLVLILVAALAIGLVPVAIGAAWIAGRRAALPAGGRATDGTQSMDEATAATVALVERVSRVVALLFIAAAGVVIALSGAWADRAVALYVLLGGATLFVVLTQDLLPRSVGAVARYWTGAIGTVLFLALLTGLTGGASSPFAIGWFLLVGGAALGARGASPIAIALVSSAAWVLVSAIAGVIGGIDAIAAGQLALCVVGLLLLAYVGTVAGREQQRAKEEALRLSRFDTLTGLANRAAFYAAVEREISRVGRMGRGFCVLMVDVDDLKPVNDTFGHPAGDDLLRTVTGVITRTIRVTDTAGRYGGDEFMVLLPETEPEGAYTVADKLRREVARLGFRVGERTIRTSISIGLVAFPEDGSTMDALISAADAAMYEAKRRGKNQIVGYATRTERVATPIPALRERDEDAETPLDDRRPTRLPSERRPSLPPQPLAPWEASAGSSPELPAAPREAGTGTWGSSGRPGPTTVEEPGGRRYVVFPIDPDDRAR